MDASHKIRGYVVEVVPVAAPGTGGILGAVRGGEVDVLWSRIAAIRGINAYSIGSIWCWPTASIVKVNVVEIWLASPKKIDEYYDF